MHTITRKAKLGQFFTSKPIAQFMASLFAEDSFSDVRLLDPGAGNGILSVAFIERMLSEEASVSSARIDAYEIDPALETGIQFAFASIDKRTGIEARIVMQDFIQAAVDAVSGNLFAKEMHGYTHVIMNPPYKKIRSNSHYRLALHSIGIETVNLYSAFVALALELLDTGGQLVAIIPRSFCNGPYYRPFRERILQKAAIHRIHLFGSRRKLFQDDNVLQENIIVMLKRNTAQSTVIVSSSSDAGFDDMELREYPIETIVHSNDRDNVIHIPSPGAAAIHSFSAAKLVTLADLGIQVSTGPVVEYRMKDNIHSENAPLCIPLIYPSHFSGMRIVWPKPEIRKPNYIENNDRTGKYVFPGGYYTVVRRFSSKEEKKRIVAAVMDPSTMPSMKNVGFENHLNVFHSRKNGLDENVAYGLTQFLNTMYVDRLFRTFNGHTQVNASDLRSLRYPKMEILLSLGRWSRMLNSVSQNELDTKFEEIMK